MLLIRFRKWQLKKTHKNLRGSADKELQLQENLKMLPVENYFNLIFP